MKVYVSKEAREVANKLPVKRNFDLACEYCITEFCEFDNKKKSRHNRSKFSNCVRVQVERNYWKSRK